MGCRAMCEKDRPRHATVVRTVSLEDIELDNEPRDPCVNDDEDWWPSLLDDHDEED